jgi:hypothetical protein
MPARPSCALPEERDVRGRTDAATLPMAVHDAQNLLLKRRPSAILRYWAIKSKEIPALCISRNVQLSECISFTVTLR